MAKYRKWRMEKINQRFRRDQIDLIDGLVASLVDAGAEAETVNRSNVLRLSVDLGLAVLEEVTVPELLEELQREHDRKYDTSPAPR